MPNNETFGISTELTICDEYNLANSINLERTNKNCVNIVKPVIEKMKSETQINIIEHWGGNNGSIDFKYKEGNETKTLSVKTNKSKSGPKVCPQNIGQPTKKKFLEWFSLPQNSDNIDIKNYIIENTERLIKDYYNNLFCCNKLLWIYKNNTNKFDYKLMEKSDYPFTDNNFTFTRYIKDEDIKNSKSKKAWVEGTTVKYNNISIGEFQLHNNRDCIKFRFFMRNLIKFI